MRRPSSRGHVDEADEDFGDLPAPEHEQAGAGSQDLSVSPAWGEDRATEPCLAMDITYIPMRRGFVYLAAVVDVSSRRVLAHRVSITMEAAFCVEALEEALAKHGKPDIFNTDQGSQFSSLDFTSVLTKAGVAISMDGKGAWRDNVFVERLWRTVKYEEVYLRAYDSVSQARASISRYLAFYNRGRPHSSLDERTPDEAYFGVQAMATAA